VKQLGAEPLALELDLMNPSSAETVVKAALDRFSRMDALLLGCPPISGSRHVGGRA
jgi:hypothetical protein